jgi:hypothetical protein
MFMTVVTITTRATSKVIKAIWRARTPYRGSGERLEDASAYASTGSFCTNGVSAVAVAMIKPNDWR